MLSTRLRLRDFCTFALHSWPKDTNSTGVNCGLHVEPGREVGHILATIADGECVRARVQRDVGDGVGPISVVLDMDLSLGATVRDDLDGQFCRTSICTVHDELSCFPDLGSLQTWPRAANLIMRIKLV